MYLLAKTTDGTVCTVLFLPRSRLAHDVSISSRLTLSPSSPCFDDVFLSKCISTCYFDICFAFFVRVKSLQGEHRSIGWIPRTPWYGLSGHGVRDCRTVSNSRNTGKTGRKHTEVYFIRFKSFDKLDTIESSPPGVGNFVVNCWRFF